MPLLACCTKGKFYAKSAKTIGIKASLAVQQGRHGIPLVQQANIGIKIQQENFLNFILKYVRPTCRLMELTGIALRSVRTFSNKAIIDECRRIC